MGPGNNDTTDSAEWHHISKVQKANPFNHHVNYIWQMLKHSDRGTSVYYMENTLLYHTL